MAGMFKQTGYGVGYVTGFDFLHIFCRSESRREKRRNFWDCSVASPQQSAAGEQTETKQPCACSCTPGAQTLPGEYNGNGKTTSLVHRTTSTLTFANYFDHFLARWGWNRGGHRVEPGLDPLGNPTPQSPVFASANYTLSFDALRSALTGVNAWILVLDTKGINVWCAAGKGTFGTDELVNRILSTGLQGQVSHRKIIVPQLGAPGISWPEVMRRSQFLVEYGPVRAADLPQSLKKHTATPEMRRVRFPFRDRVVLTPVEFVHLALPMVVAAALLWFLAGTVAALAAARRLGLTRSQLYVRLRRYGLE